MKRSHLLNVLSIPVFLIAVGCGVLLTGPASADHENSGALSNYRNPGYRTPGYRTPGNRVPGGSNPVRGVSGVPGISGGGGYRPSPAGPGRYHDHYRHDWRLQERNRGLGAGQRAGWQVGYQAGYRGSALYSACGVFLARESLPYQRGFREGYESAYERGYYAGKQARRRQHERRYPIRSGFQIRIGF